MTMIDEIRKDVEAGTDGPWEHNPDMKWCVVSASGLDVIHDEYGLADSVDVRRASRVPDMEAALLAAEELAGAVENFNPLKLGTRLKLDTALTACRKATGADQ